MDVGPMEPCPHTKRGRHNLCIVIPETADGDLTLFCDRCGSLRRLPASGMVPLDDLSAATIARLVGDG